MFRQPATNAFPGTSDLSQRFRDHDWTATPLGPYETWPQSLKIAVRIMLGSRYAMWLGWGPDLTFLYNDAYARMTLGPKHPWALGRATREVWAEIWSDLAPRIQQVLTSGEATWDEGLLLFLERRGFPEETYHTFSYSPLPDDAGDIGGMLCVVAEDTERTIGERRLKTLRELATRTTEAITSAEDACRAAARTFATNPHDLPFVLLYLIDADERTSRLAGSVGLETEAPAAPAVIDLTAPAYPGSWPLGESSATGRPVVFTGIETRLGSARVGVYPEPPHTAVVLPIHKSGQDKRAGFLVAGVSPRRPLDDSYRGFFDLLVGQVATAIAHARAYEEERRRAESLAELDRAKTAFFSNVSHEFRTPLTLMLGPVEELLATHALAPTNRESLAIVHRNGLRLQKLVNTLLDFSRIEAGRAHASFEATDLAALTADLASNFRSACERAGLEFVVDCPPLAEPVFVDHDMWEKVVLNLLSNAFKYTLAGRIEVHLRQTGSNAELVVRDTGTGIPMDQLPRLFERFYRVAGAVGRTQEGSGIGLALVRELVRLHGGEVRAESQPGSGSTFTVTIPLGRAHLPQDRTLSGRTPTSTATGAAAYVEEALRWLPSERTDIEPREVGSEADTPEDRSGSSGPRLPSTPSPLRPRVLLADDNADMREYVRRLLVERYDVDTVTNGAEALAAVRRAVPDLVLSDVMMPTLDGFGLLRELRADPATAAVPVLLVSARAGEEARVEGLRAGADDYLTKPFGARELMARVEAHLALARLRRETEQRARTILESITDAFFALDREWRFTYVNRSAELLLNRTRADLLGKNLWTEFAPAVDTAFRIEFTRAAADRVAVNFEEYHSPHGRWYEVRAYPSAVGLSVYFRDVTERKRVAEAEQFLAEAGTALASSLDYETTLAAVARLAVPRLSDWCSVYLTEAGSALRRIAVAHTDPAKIRWAEEMAHRYPPNPNEPSGVGGVIRTGEPLLLPDVTDALLSAGARDPGHLALLREVGIRSAMIVPLIARDRTLGAITFVATESGRRFGPTDLALAQELGRRAALAVDNARLFHESSDALHRLGVLVEASGRLTSSLELSAVQTAILDLSHRLVAADAYAMWRVDAETNEWFIANSANLSETYVREEGRIPAGQAIVGRPIVSEDAQASVELESRRRAYRSEGIVSVLAVPLRVHGPVAGTLAFYYKSRHRFDDVTVRVASALADLAGAALGTAELYQRESASRHRAEEADRAKDEFLALLGHELRNPIAPIKNALQILELKGHDAVAATRARAMIDRQATHLTRLVDELLDASRITRGKVRLTLERLDLAALVRIVTEDHRVGVEKASLRLEVDAPTHPIRVRGDSARLTQVISNLLANATKFTRPGGCVTVRLRAPGGTAVLTVSDTGIGIAASDLPAVFHPFYQVNADPARTKGGLGLGLAVVKGLIELHGGRIEAASPGLDKGATFTAYLPLDDTGPVALSIPQKTGATGGGRRVVIVEDGIDTAESLAEVLGLKGFAVSIATTGPDGVALCRRERPDGVVCDIGLPGMTGFEVARVLRADPTTAGAILLAVSGYAQEDDRQKATQAGFDALLAKPADIEQLIRLLTPAR